MSLEEAKELRKAQQTVNDEYEFGYNIFVYVDSKTKRLVTQVDTNPMASKSKLVTFSFEFNYRDYKDYLIEFLSNYDDMNEVKRLLKNITEITESEVPVDLGSYFRKIYRRKHKEYVLEVFNKFMDDYIGFKTEEVDINID